MANDASFESIVNLIGKDKNEVLNLLGKESDILKGDDGLKTYIYKGISILIDDKVCSQVTFYKGATDPFIPYDQVVFPGFTFNGNRKNAEKMTFPIMVAHFKKPLHEMGNEKIFMEYFWAGDSVSAMFINQGEDISSLRITGENGKKFVLSNLKFKHWANNIPKLIGFSGRNILYTLFGKEKNIISNEEAFVYMYRGFSILTDKTENRKITAVWYFNNDENYMLGFTRLPFGLGFNMSSTEFKKKLGPPEEIQSQEGSLIYFYPSKGIMIIAKVMQIILIRLDVLYLSNLIA